MDDGEKEKAAQGERRQFFRVEDVLPVILKKTLRFPSEVKARVLSIPLGQMELPAPDSTAADALTARLWEILADIRAKLDLILEKLSLQEEGLAHVESRPVSLSAKGLCVRTEQDFSLGDFLEIRIQITLPRPVWILLYGEVTRVERHADRACEIAISFAEMDGSIRDLISQYTLKRQRELIRSHRGIDGSWQGTEP